MNNSEDFLPCKDLFDYLEVKNNNLSVLLSELDQYFPDYLFNYVEDRIFPDLDLFYTLLNSKSFTKHIKNSGFLYSIEEEINTNGAKYDKLIYNLENGFNITEVDYFNTMDFEGDSQLKSSELTRYIEKCLVARGWYTPDGINYYHDEDLFDRVNKMYDINPDE